MLSGLSASESARRHAEELLAAGRRWRREATVATRPSSCKRRCGSASAPRSWSSAAPGEIAVIDHADLDRVAAEGLIEADAAAVVNVGGVHHRPLPEHGPAPRRGGGHRAARRLGPQLMASLRDGDIVTVVDNEVWRGEEQLGSGRRRDVTELEDEIDRARRTLGAGARAVRQEHPASTSSASTTWRPTPPTCRRVRTSFKGRHALVVVRGHDYREDLAALKRSGYLREVKPVTIGVDGGADALLELGLKPDMIIGDFDSVSERALRCGAELDRPRVPRWPGARRRTPRRARPRATSSSRRRARARTSRCCSPTSAARSSSSRSARTTRWRSSSTRAAPAWRRPSSCGCGWDGSSSTPKGVSRLYRPVVKTRDIGALIVGAVAALLAVTLVNEPLRLWLRSLWTYLRSGLG